MVLSSAEKSRRWRENHPGEMAEHNRQYRENHPERRREQRWKLNGIQYNGRPFSFEDYEREYKRINGECEICGEENIISEDGEETCEHLVDLSRSGFEFKGESYECPKGHDLDFYKLPDVVGCDKCERTYAKDEIVIS